MPTLCRQRRADIERPVPATGGFFRTFEKLSQTLGKLFQTFGKVIQTFGELSKTFAIRFYTSNRLSKT